MDPYLPPRPWEYRLGGGGSRRAQAVLIVAAVFLVTLALGMILTGSVAAGFGIAAACTLIAALALAATSGAARPGPVVRFSQHGVELADGKGFRVRMGWADITHIGFVYTQMANPRQVGGVTVGAVRSTGIVGWGERIVPPDIPEWLRATLAAQPVNPVDGRPQVTIPLGGIDPHWESGAMGAWLRRYRPDLRPPG